MPEGKQNKGLRRSAKKSVSSRIYVGTTVADSQKAVEKLDKEAKGLIVKYFYMM